MAQHVTTNINDESKQRDLDNQGILVVETSTIGNPMVVSICISKYDHLLDLPGVVIDAQTISNLFDYYYGYSMMSNNVNDRMTKVQFWDLLATVRDELLKNSKKYDGLIMLLSGHGDRGVICPSDADPSNMLATSIEVNDIQEYFYGNNLLAFVNRAKVLYIDACRGENDIVPVHKSISDMAIATKAVKLNQAFHPGQDFSVIFGNVLGYTTIDTSGGGMLIKSIDSVFRGIAVDTLKYDFDGITMQLRHKVLDMSKRQMIVDSHTTNTADFVFKRQRYVVGTNAASEVFVKEGGSWTKWDGGLVNVSIGSDGSVWGVNKSDNIFYRDFGNNKWVQVDGALTNVSCGNAANVWGCNNDGNIFYRDFGNNKWVQVDGALKNISCSCGDTNNVWGCNKDDYIFYRDFTNNKWVQVDGRLRVVSCGGSDNVWGVNSDDSIYYRDFNEHKWVQVDGKLTWVSAGTATGEVWGCNKDDKIYYQDFKNNGWIQFGGALRCINIR